MTQINKAPLPPGFRFWLTLGALFLLGSNAGIPRVLNAPYPAQNGLYALVWEVLSGISALLLLRYAWFPEFGAKASQTNPARSADKAHVLQRIADNMVAVEGGTFTMGCTEEQGGECSDDEKPAHQVTLSNFSIGKYEVTQEEWEAVMGDKPSHFQGARRPVEMVSWNDIQQFLERLNQLTGKNYRLPTEAEWEYAARGGKHSKGFRYSGSNDLDSVAWFDGNSMKQTHNVGQKQPNELGLYDMSGNVWEWCNDWFDATYYGGSEEQNPPGPAKGARRVLRGGSWAALRSTAVFRTAASTTRSPATTAATVSVWFPRVCSGSLALVS